MSLNLFFLGFVEFLGYMGYFSSGLFFIKFRMFLPIISYSFCPFTSFFSGNSTELILLSFMVSHVSEALFTFIVFFLFLRLNRLSWFIFKFDDFFLLSCSNLLFSPSSEMFVHGHLNSRISIHLLFYNFSLLSETLFS